MGSDGVLVCLVCVHGSDCASLSDQRGMSEETADSSGVKTITTLPQA